MAARLTDKQKKDIIADYVETGSYRATAKRFGVSDNTVKKICAQNADIMQICAQKKEQNTKDMLAYMDSRKWQAQGIIDSYLKKLADPDKLDSASLSQIATAMGIVVDKFINNTTSGGESTEKEPVVIELTRNGKPISGEQSEDDNT